jgi:hypothetical protein
MILKYRDIWASPVKYPRLCPRVFLVSFFSFRVRQSVLELFVRSHLLDLTGQLLVQFLIRLCTSSWTYRDTSTDCDLFPGLGVTEFTLVVNPFIHAL